MKYVLALLAAAGFYLALPGETAACEGCVQAGETQPTQVACFTAPDGPGEICTSGGGYCEHEGKCKVQMTGEGSLTPLEQLGRYADAETKVLRRECDGGVIGRRYTAAEAEQLRHRSASLSI